MNNNSNMINNNETTTPPRLKIFNEANSNRDRIDSLKNIPDEGAIYKIPANNANVNLSDLNNNLSFKSEQNSSFNVSPGRYRQSDKTAVGYNSMENNSISMQSINTTCNSQRECNMPNPGKTKKNEVMNVLTENPEMFKKYMNIEAVTKKMVVREVSELKTELFQFFDNLMKSQKNR